LENLDISRCFSEKYKNTRVLITGNTGFKGSWLALWLYHLQAKISGYSLTPPTDPNHFSLLNLDYPTTIGDIRDKAKLQSTFDEVKPEIVFHLAAQPLVRYSYGNPHETIDVNIMGLTNLLEICRSCKELKAIVVITSDKCYQNLETGKSFVESDPMGGYDPYSMSKACAELIAVFGIQLNIFLKLDTSATDSITSPSI